MREITDQEEILQVHKEWATNHFHSKIAKEPPDKPKIEITIQDTQDAMNKISKGKATSTDKIQDLIFDKANYLHIILNGERFDLSAAYNKEDAQNW